MAQGDFDHGAPVSFLISANQALGMTEGELLIGDANSVIGVHFEKCRHAGIGLMMHRNIHNSYLCRFVVTLKELDDTSRGRHDSRFDFEFKLLPKMIIQ